MSTVDEWMEKMWNIYTIVYYSHKQEQNSVICDSMDDPGGHYIK